MATRARDTAPPGKAANRPTPSSKSSTVGSGSGFGSKPRRKTNTNSPAPTSTSGSSSKRAPNDARPTGPLAHENPRQPGKKPILGGDAVNKPVRRRSFDRPSAPSNAQNIGGALGPKNRSLSFSEVSTMPGAGPASGQSPSFQTSTFNPSTGKPPSSRRSTLSPKLGQSPLSGRSTFTPTPGSSSSSTTRSMTPASSKVPKEVGKQHASNTKSGNSNKKRLTGFKKKDTRRGPSLLKEQPESLPREKIDDQSSDNASEYEVKSQDEELESKSTIDDKHIVADASTGDSPKGERKLHDDESSVDETEQQTMEIGMKNVEQNIDASRLEAHEEVTNDEEAKRDEEGETVPVESSTTKDAKILDVDSNTVTEPKNTNRFNADDSNTTSVSKNVNEPNTAANLKNIDDESKPIDTKLVPPKSSTRSQATPDESSALFGQDEEPRDNIGLDQSTTSNPMDMKEKEEETKTVGSETKVEEARNTKKDPEKVVPKSQAQDTKQKDNVVSNDAIEETAAKLREQRKSRVRALAGAFETVISLQDSKS